MTPASTLAIKLDSLVVPILVRYKLRPSGRGLVVFAGPSLGFKMSAKATAEVGGETTTDDIGDDIESFDYGVVFGAGWEAGRLLDRRPLHVGSERHRQRRDRPEKTTHRVIAVMAGIRF